MTPHILLWNLEWASLRSPRGRRIRAILAEFDPDVVFLTETTAAMLPHDGFACPTGNDAGWVRGQIDHLLVGTGVEVLDVAALPRVADDGLRQSDHDGLVVRVETAP